MFSILGTNLNLWSKFLCSGPISGYLDDEPPPRLPVNSVKSHVAPALDLIISDCKLQKFTTEENDLESTAGGLFDKLEAMHGTSFKIQNGKYFHIWLSKKF